MTKDMAAQIKDMKAAFSAFSITVENGVEAAVRDSSLIVEADAKRLSPVDTGRLRASITHRVNRNKMEQSVDAEIGSNVEYAASIEYGHSRQAPEGYLRPALLKNEGKIIKKIQLAIKAAAK